MYDNFLRQGYTKRDCHVHTGENGLTLATTLTNTIHKNHGDPKAAPLGARLYASLKKSHPSGGTASQLPAPEPTDVPCEELRRAMNENKAAIMRKRELINQALKVMVAVNTKECEMVCTYFLRLNARNDAHRTDGMRVVQWLHKHEIKTRFPAYFAAVRQKVDMMLVEVPRNDSGQTLAATS